MTKEKRIEQETKKLMELFTELPPNKLELITPWINNAGFMKVTLEDLQQAINEEGLKERYQNSESQYGFKASTNLSAYNSLLKSYTSTIDRLAKYLPNQKAVSKLDELLNE